MVNLNKIFELGRGRFILVTSYDSKLNSVDQESKIVCGPTVDTRQDIGVYDSWAYAGDLPREAARYVPPTIRRALESFRTASP